ncbi:ParA family protein (plasmid) [Ampullimonas aquatilis]|uniref:ParA family protein n=1 Tax=Ampullimonas aquatilis TaxID=1341549 RepID=UPI003C77048B
MKKLVLANQKGGVGKSAIAVQFAYYLVKSGLRVLFIDFDHQKNSTNPIIKSGKAELAPFSSSDLLQGAYPRGYNSQKPFLLIGGDDNLSALERKPDSHNEYVSTLHNYLREVDREFDVCILDTNPNPDIRYAAALITSDFLLSPVMLNQEALDGIVGLLNHPRYGFIKIQKVMNKQLQLIGILPNLVEATPFQKENFKSLVKTYSSLLIMIDQSVNQFAFIPNRTAIPEAQASGEFIAEMKKTSARDAWRLVYPSFHAIAKKMQLGI